MKTARCYLCQEKRVGFPGGPSGSHLCVVCAYAENTRAEKKTSTTKEATS